MEIYTNIHIHGAFGYEYWINYRLIKITDRTEPVLRRQRVTLLGICLRVIVNEILIKFEKATSTYTYMNIGYVHIHGY